MTTRQQQDLASETYRHLVALLGPKTASTIRHPDKDPQILAKGDRDIVHLRVLPARSEMKPAGFWHGTGCYYEILVGPLKTARGLCLGSIQFFRYADQIKCGGSKFTPGILRILKNLKGARAKGFTLTTPGYDGKFHFQRHYYVKDSNRLFYPCKLAASDLAWPVANTLPRFQAL
jgi:hypothetical protein